MANEITVLDGDERDNYTLLFLYPIVTPKVVGGSNIILTPSAALPALASKILAAGEKSALDAGASAFEVVSFHKLAGQTNPQVVAAAKDAYGVALAQFNQRYSDRYQFLGTRITYP